MFHVVLGGPEPGRGARRRLLAGDRVAGLGDGAARTEGGWLLTGQKVWKSLAHVADWGICLARTDPDAPKHEGIGCFLVDMASEGLDVRPLRELTGAEMFNETPSSRTPSVTSSRPANRPSATTEGSVSSAWKILVTEGPYPRI